MKNDVTCEVFFSHIRLKTTVQLRCFHIFNQHAHYSMISKPLMSFFQYYDVSVTATHAQVSNVGHLTATKLVLRYFAIAGESHCYCLQSSTDLNIDCSLHSGNPELLQTVLPLYYSICNINNNPVQRFRNVIFLWCIRCLEVLFDALLC